MFGMKQTLQNAYNALMAKAPGAAFPRARRLYLNKYQLPQSDEKHGLRLFVSEESLDESQHPAEDGEPHHRIVTLNGNYAPTYFTSTLQKIRNMRGADKR